MAETYIKVAGKDRYLYRAVNRNNFWNKNIKIRRCKYLNNCVEQDHRNIKRRIAIDTGFKEFESAQRTSQVLKLLALLEKIKSLILRNPISKLSFH